MKKIMIMATLMIAGLAINAQANDGTQSDCDPAEMEQFFLGKWNLMVEGLPTGDTPMLLVLEKRDGELRGTLGGENGEGASELTDLVISGKTLECNFSGGGWEIPIYLDRNDDGTISGSMNDMFDITGEKITE